MAPLLTLHLSRAADPTATVATTETLHSLAKRYYYYYYTPNTGAIIAGIVISVIFLLLALLSCFMRMKYGYSWYGRRPRYPATSQPYTGPYSTAAGYTGGYNSQTGPGGQRQWPGQQGAAPGTNGASDVDMNAYGGKRGPGTYQPPPMYSGPGAFYQAGRHGQGTSHGDDQARAEGRLSEHPGLRDVPT